MRKSLALILAVGLLAAACGDDDTTQIGRPAVSGAVVKGAIVEQKRGKKIVVFKMKRRKTYRRTKGHRQHFTQLRITAIQA